MDFLEHMQNVVPDAADPLISGVQMNVEDGQVEVQGLYLGEKSNLENVLKSSKMFGFTNKINSQQMTWIESAIKFAEYPSVKKPEDMAKTKDIEAKYRDYFNLNSFYIIPSKPLPKEAFEKMLDWAKQNKDGFIEFDLMGPKVCCVFFMITESFGRTFILILMFTRINKYNTCRAKLHRLQVMQQHTHTELLCTLCNLEMNGKRNRILTSSLARQLSSTKR